VNINKLLLVERYKFILELSQLICGHWHYVSIQLSPTGGVQFFWCTPRQNIWKALWKSFYLIPEIYNHWRLQNVGVYLPVEKRPSRQYTCTSNFHLQKHDQFLGLLDPPCSFTSSYPHSCHLNSFYRPWSRHLWKFIITKPWISLRHVTLPIHLQPLTILLKWTMINPGQNDRRNK